MEKDVEIEEVESYFSARNLETLRPNASGFRSLQTRTSYQ